jgi:SAM-dependent methyltransferase
MLIKKILKSIKQNSLDRLFPNWALERRQKKWETNWSKQEYNPDWRITEIPEELKEAVNSKWFPPGSSIVDIGCGSGEIAAWLSQQNYQATGFDFSQSAIDIAKKTYGKIQNQLEFKVVDICRDVAVAPKFDAFFDRGCFHTIPKNFSQDYVKTIISYARMKAKFLLLYATNKDGKQGETQEEKMRQNSIQYIRNNFEPWFEIIKIQPTFIERNSLQGSASAIAVWMIRQTQINKSIVS